MKKSWIFILPLFLINFISAAYGYYGQSLSDILYRWDPTTIVLICLFVIFFAVLNWVLGKYFQDNKATAGIVAFAASLLAVYGIWWSGFDIGNIFYDLGLGDFFYTILPLAALALVIFLIWKFKRKALLFIGLILIGLGFFTEERGSLWLIGGILAIIWFFIRKKKESNQSPSSGWTSSHT